MNKRPACFGPASPLPCGDPFPAISSPQVAAISSDRISSFDKVIRVLIRVCSEVVIFFITNSN